MARFELNELSAGTVGASLTPGAEMLMDMGMRCASGRDGTLDLVAAHMYFNLADREGCDDAAYYRQEVAAQMSKAEVAKALRAARDFLSMH